MTNARVSRLRRENETLRQQIDLMGALAADAGQHDKLTAYEQVQADAIELVSRLSSLPWMRFDNLRSIAAAILMESKVALDVLDSGGSLDNCREPE